MALTGTVTAANLRAIGASKAPLADEIAEAFNVYGAEFGVTSALRQAHFFAQLSHESGGFQFIRELWGPTAAQKRYEGRKDLGNAQPGDGSLYRGRGPIQITGRDNYRAFTAWIRTRVPNAPDFEAQPALLEQFPWALLAAFWFWDTRKLNALADRDDVLAVTKKINGGTNGLADRKLALARAKQQFGITAAPKPATPKPASDRMAIPSGKWAEAALPAFEIRAIQEQLDRMGYKIVGVPDGIWGDRTTAAVKALQEQASRRDPSVVPDGHYGPQTKALLADPVTNKAEVSAVRGNATAGDLAKIGTPGVVVGGRIKWTSLFGLVASLAGAAYSAWQAPAEMPFGSSLALAWLPPWVQAMAPFLLTFIPSAYTLIAGSGLIGTTVERFRQGIDNTGLPPANEPGSRAPVPGGLFGSLFGGRA